MENYQTLCASCNTKKNDTPDMSVQEAIAAGLTTQEIQDVPKRDKKEFI